MKDPLLLKNYYTFTLPSKNELFSYNESKFCLIEYINMYAELKNIYRSYLVVKMLTEPANIRLFLKTPAIANSQQQLIEIIIENIKEALTKSYYSNVEHFLVVFKTFLAIDTRAVLRMCRKYLIINKCIDLLENPLIYQFLIFMMVLPECDPENENAMAREIIKTGVLKLLCEAIYLTRKPPEQNIDYIRGLMDENLLMGNLFSQSTKQKKQCTEVYALSVFEVLFSLVMVFMDQHNRAVQGSLDHLCEKHDIFLEYLFKEDSIFMNSLFIVFVDYNLGIY